MDKVRADFEELVRIWAPEEWSLRWCEHQGYINTDTKAAWEIYQTGLTRPAPPEVEK